MQQGEFLERARKALIKHGIIGSRAKWNDHLQSEVEKLVAGGQLCSKNGTIISIMAGGKGILSVVVFLAYSEGPGIYLMKSLLPGYFAWIGIG